MTITSQIAQTMLFLPSQRQSSPSRPPFFPPLAWSCLTRAMNPCTTPCSDSHWPARAIIRGARTKRFVLGAGWINPPQSPNKCEQTANGLREWKLFAIRLCKNRGWAAAIVRGDALQFPAHASVKGSRRIRQSPSVRCHWPPVVAMSISIIQMPLKRLAGQFAPSLIGFMAPCYQHDLRHKASSLRPVWSRALSQTGNRAHAGRQGAARRNPHPLLLRGPKNRRPTAVSGSFNRAPAFSL